LFDQILQPKGQTSGGGLFACTRVCGVFRLCESSGEADADGKSGKQEVETDMGNNSRQKRGSKEQPGSKVTRKKEQKVCVLEEASEDRGEGIKSELRYGVDKYRA